MFHFYFKFIDGNEIGCSHIERIEFPGNPEYVKLSGDELLNYHYGYDEIIHLYSSNSNYSVNCKGLLYCQVVKE